MTPGTRLYCIEHRGWLGRPLTRAVVDRELAGMQAEVRAECTIVTLQVVEVEQAGRAERDTERPAAGREEPT